VKPWPAGVHKTTVYRRWPTRTQLLLDALLERSRRGPDPDTGLREDLAP
jgi:AcrR family transcriptional regulator